MGTLLVNERMIESYVYARDKFLKPGGEAYSAGAAGAAAHFGAPQRAGTLPLLPSADQACCNCTLGEPGRRAGGLAASPLLPLPRQ